MAAADLYPAFGDDLLPLTDVGGQLQPLTSMLAQVGVLCGCVLACASMRVCLFCCNFLVCRVC